jgi:hypothetical protein
VIAPGALPNRPAQPGLATPGADGKPQPGTNASELWIALSQLPRPVSPAHTLRAKGVEVGTLVFWVLTSDELAQTYVQAHKATRDAFGVDDAKGTIAYEEYYLEQKALHLIANACRQPEDVRFPVFPTAKDVRLHLTDDEAGVVLSAYNIFRRESGPILSEITPEVVDAWIEVLQEGASRLPLARCGGDAMTDLVMSLVLRLPRASLTATSSAGAPPDTSSTPPTPASAEPGDVPAAPT